MAMVLVLERTPRKAHYSTPEYAETRFIESSVFGPDYISQEEITRVSVDDVDVVYTTTEYYVTEPLLVEGVGLTEKILFSFLEVAIASYTEDSLQHKVTIDWYRRDEISGEELTQSFDYYTIPRNRGVQNCIGDHLFRSEVFAKPFDLHLGLLIALSPNPVEMSRFCLSTVNHTRITDLNEVETYSVDAGTASGYERMRVTPNQFEVPFDILPGLITDRDYSVTNSVTFDFSTLRESCTIVGIGVYLNPFHTSPITPPILTVALDTPITYVATSPSRWGKDYYGTKGEKCDDVTIRAGGLRFLFGAGSFQSASFYMRKLLCRHIFLQNAFVESDDLVNKPSGFYVGLLLSLTVNANHTETITEPTGGGYARAFYPSGDSSWGVTGQTYENLNPVVLNNVPTNQGPAVGYGLFSTAAPLGGGQTQLCFHALFDTPVDLVANGSTYTFLAHQIAITFN